MAGLSLEQKRDWAKTLISKEGYTQKEAAAKVGVSVVTMNKWYKKYNWVKLKQSLLVTKDAQLSRLYMQMDELTTSIMNREEGKRFADSKEADTLNKIAATIKTLETDASIAEIVEVGKRFLNFLRAYSPDKAIEVAGMFDEFIKEELAK